MLKEDEDADRNSKLAHHLQQPSRSVQTSTRTKDFNMLPKLLLVAPGRRSNGMAGGGTGGAAAAAGMGGWLVASREEIICT